MAKRGAFKFESYLKEVQRNVQKGYESDLREAADHMKKALRAKLKKMSGPSKEGEPPHLHTQNLKRGIASKLNKGGSWLTGSVYVGFRAPAHHAHLLEFGTRERRRADGKPTGRVRKRPFFGVTFEEEAAEIARIMGARS